MKRGILFDPRTKLFMLLTITTLMFSTSNEGSMNVVKPLLSLVPFLLLITGRQLKTAGKYMVLYIACFILERVALYFMSGIPAFILMAVCSIMTRFAPGIMIYCCNGADAYYRKNCNSNVSNFSIYSYYSGGISGN